MPIVYKNYFIAIVLTYTLFFNKQHFYKKNIYTFIK